jgi:hypothetical protein
LAAGERKKQPAHGPHFQKDVPRITPAVVGFKLGETASIKAQYLMTCELWRRAGKLCPRTVTDLPGGDASFIFTETCSGEVDGKKGSFISQGKGTFDSKTYVAAGDFTVVEGSGSERAISSRCC